MRKYGEVRLATGANTIRSMSFACWVNKATDTHLEYILLVAFPLLQWVGQRHSTLLFKYIGCLICEHDYFLAKDFRLCEARLHYWVSTPDCGTDFPLHKPAQPKSGASQPPIQSIPGIVSLYVRWFRWSSVSHAGLWFPSSRVQTRQKPLDFFCVQNPQHAFLRRGS
jgi:hypothetical protein